jgi:hypothetical protein
MAKTFPFVLHDESLNTHGFRMLTSGADPSVFKSNPVMLFNHDDWSMPIGRWENIRIEKGRILADAVFDEDDDRGAEVMGKVERKFIRAASIGAWATETSSDPSVMLPGQTFPTVTRWTPREASICTIGSNHSALALYDRQDKLINLSDAGVIDKLFNNIPQREGITTIKKADMSKLTALLKLSDAASEDAVAGEVQRILGLSDRLTTEASTLKKEKEALEVRLSALEAKEKAACKTEATVLLNDAIRDGRINNEGRAPWEKAFEADFASAKVQLSSIPRPASVAGQISQTPSTGGGGGGGGGVKNLSDLSFKEILAADRLKELKRDGELYKNKFNEAYGRYPS